MEEAARLKRDRQEHERTESLARSKVEAKEAAKEAAVGNKRVSPATKTKLEEELGRKHPGTPGLSGKQHSATGSGFLKTLLKSAQDSDYTLPPWEDRHARLLEIYIQS